MGQTEWIGGRLTAPLYVTEDGPFRPDIILWLEAESDIIVGSTIVHPSEPNSAVARCLAEALDKPMIGPPRRPDRIRIADPMLLNAVREIVGPGVRIDTAPTPELDAVVQLMAKTLPEDIGEEVSYFEAGRVSATSLAALFKSAARLYRTAPWGLIWDSQVVMVDVPELEIARACVSVIGALGESFGVLIYDSIDGYLAMDAVGAVLEETGDVPDDLGVSMLSLNFEREGDVPPAMRREIAEHGWEVAGPNAHPVVMFVEGDRLLRPLTERDIRLVTVVAEALAAFFTHQRDRLSAELSEPITEELVVHLGADAFTARVTAPHPDLPWDDGEDDEGEEGNDEAAQLLDAFVKAQTQRGKDAAGWIDAAAFVCDALLRYKLDYADGRLDHFTAADVEDFLLDHFPRKVTADAQMIQRTPEVLLAFFAWLQETGRLSARAAQAIARRISSKQAPFYRYASDPSRFGVAKSVVTLAQERGIDFSDEVQMNGFITEYNEMLRDGRVDPTGSLFPLAAAARPSDTPARSARSPKQRWAPQPGEPPLDPASRCPCGSGRRYKKCCMQR